MSYWPDIPYERFRETGDSLHMWTQIVGKFRLANTPWLNHSWQVPMYVTARGLTTSLIPCGRQDYEIAFDFVDHRLDILCTDGRHGSISLGPISVAQFYESFLAELDQLGAPTDIHHSPNEVADPVPFCEQTAPGAYDQAAVQNFWRAMVATDRVFKHFRTGFLGKASPVHFFWGSFDLAVTRFSGRPAPRHPGGFPAMPDTVTREAYSHEVSSAGFWPGGMGIDYPVFYSYAYPTPEGFGAASVQPDEAFFSDALGEFLLPYDAVRNAADPEAALMSFLQSTYEAAADLADWDRPALDCATGRPGIPRPV